MTAPESLPVDHAELAALRQQLEAAEKDADRQIVARLAAERRVADLEARLAEVTAEALEADGHAGTLTGNLAVDMAAYAGRLKDRVADLEAGITALADEWEQRRDNALKLAAQPGTNLGQQWHGREVAENYDYFAAGVRSLLSQSGKGRTEGQEGD